MRPEIFSQSAEDAKNKQPAGVSRGVERVDLNALRAATSSNQRIGSMRPIFEPLQHGRMALSRAGRRWMLEGVIPFTARVFPFRHGLDWQGEASPPSRRSPGVFALPLA